MPATEVPRTLADQLRGWSDERLGGLLADRPDLAAPVPQDSAQLASRAATRTSLLRAMDSLTRLELAVLEALVVRGPCSAAELTPVVHAEPAAVASAVERLVDLVVAWGSPEGLRALTGVADGLRGVGGTGLRPWASGLDGAEVAGRLADLSPAARAMLAYLDEHGGEGTSAAQTPASPEAAGSPAEELLARGLLVRRPGGSVALPGDVALALRGGRTTTDPLDGPPPLVSTERDAQLVERSAAGAAFELVRRTELLLDQWGANPPAALRSGGLAVRDLKATAGLLQGAEREAALLIEVASAAGLLTIGTAPSGAGGPHEPAFLPTEAFDAWSTAEPAQRWLRLVEAWLASSRLPALVGTRARGATKTWNALAPDLSSPFAVETRRMTLEALATLPDGRVPAAGTGPASVLARIEWLRPRRPATRTDLVQWALAEAAELGVTGLGGLSAAGRALLTGDRDAAATALTPWLPAPVDHVLLQADLTAVAPGPLTPTLSRRLHQVADVESRGGATVYRFTPHSLRRAFDAGWAAAEVHDLLGSISSTPVPQPLTYLVDDTARTFGTVRLGHAEAYLRADDEAALTALLHHPRAAALELRRLAPTVLVSTLPVEELLPRLRELGAAPAVEAADGSLHVARPDRLRASTPSSRRVPNATGEAARSEARRIAHLAAVVAAVRAGDRAATARPSVRSTTTPADALAALRDAVEARRSVWIGYVDAHGAVTERIVDPLSVEGGQLHAYDHRSEDHRTFAVHRITAVRPVPAPA